MFVFFGGGGGGNCFCGERKCEEYPKNERNLLLFRQNLGGKALKKSLCSGCARFLTKLAVKKASHDFPSIELATNKLIL